MADKVAVMSSGNILQIGQPNDIYDRPRSRFVAEFLGTSNIFEGTASATGMHFLLPGRSDVIEVPLQKAVVPGVSLMLSVRPERMRLGVTDATGPRFNARVTGAVFRGNYAAYQLELTELGRELFAYRQADGPLGEASHRIGDVLKVGWAPEDAVLLSAN